MPRRWYCREPRNPPDDRSLTVERMWQADSQAYRRTNSTRRIPVPLPVPVSVGGSARVAAGHCWPAAQARPAGGTRDMPVRAGPRHRSFRRAVPVLQPVPIGLVPVALVPVALVPVAQRLPRMPRLLPMRWPSAMLKGSPAKTGGGPEWLPVTTKSTRERPANPGWTAGNSIDASNSSRGSLA